MRGPEISNRLMDGAISKMGEGVAIAVPVAEQIGQTWESSVREFRSTQQCNCAAKRMLPRRRARPSSFFDFSGISSKSVQIVSLMVHPKRFQRHQPTSFDCLPGTGFGLRPVERNDRRPRAGLTDYRA